MPWPMSQDYNEALQNPQIVFSDPELRQGQVVVNALGIPQPCSGNFADVYAVECPDTHSKWAVKCFTREVQDLCPRYSEISKHLQQVRLPFAVDFQYLEQGIRIAGRWYPVLKMHWIEGFPLNAFVRGVLDKPATLEKLGRIWVRMARRLREANMAHCDLQHGNMLLVPDSEAQALAVKLIDYDGMWVPALANKPSGEAGHPAYQHPQRRRQGVYSPEVDRFGLLVVYVALRALSIGGRQLWERHDSGDNLLFRQTDFEAPAKSPLFAELLRMNHLEVCDLAEKLIDAARMPLEQTPHLADLVAEEKSSTIAVPCIPMSAASPSLPANEADPNVFQGLQSKTRRRDRDRSLLPWIAAGFAAACTLTAGALIWRSQENGASKKLTARPALAQARIEAATPRAKDHEPTARGATKSPLKVDEKEPIAAKRSKANDLPRTRPKPKTGNPPVKKAEAQPSKPEQPAMVDKLPAPDEAVLKSTTEEVQDTYKADYASKELPVLDGLAEKLFQRARRNSETPERRFVFLREASDVAAKAGNAALSVRAVDELGKLFDVEVLPMKTATLQKAAKNIHSLEAGKTFFAAARDLLAEAIQTDDYENAERLLKAEDIAASRSGILRSALRGTLGDIQNLKRKYAAIKPLLAKLSQQPRDPQANRVVGSFRCFEKGDWDEGLPLLARGDDASLRLLAKKDLSDPVSIEDRIDLGDSWRRLGSKASAAQKGMYLQRACHWYERALPEAAESVRNRLEKNVRSYNQSFASLAWGRLDISQATKFLGALRVTKEDKEIATLDSFAGPIEITALARTEKNNIRFHAGKGSCVIFNWENKREELRVTRPDGNDRPESGSLATAPLEPLQPNTWYLLSWRLTAEGMSVSVNGRTIFSELHKNDLSEKYPISVHSVDSDIEVLSFTVRRIGNNPR